MEAPRRSKRIVERTIVVQTRQIETTSVEDERPLKRARKRVSKQVETEIAFAEQTLVEPVCFTSTVHQHSKKLVGLHVSTAKGIYNAVSNAMIVGARAFAMDTKSKRRWDSPDLKEEDAQKFREACATHGYPASCIIPHGSYLMNCGSTDEVIWTKSRDCLVDEMTRCQRLALTMYNFHPGSSCGIGTVDQCLDRIAKAINYALERTQGVAAVIENMSGQGSTVGGPFEHLKGIIDRVNDKSRIGVCLDTCHMFAYGHDIRTAEQLREVLRNFDKIVGRQYLKAMHLNDCKADLGSKRDRHESIGQGNIGLESFRALMNDPTLDGIPLILETPCDTKKEGKHFWKTKYKEEISLLYSLQPGAKEATEMKE